MTKICYDNKLIGQQKVAKKWLPVEINFPI